MKDNTAFALSIYQTPEVASDGVPKRGKRR
jgi:hypothetical protein